MRKLRLRLIGAIGCLITIYSIILLYRTHVQTIAHVDRLIDHELEMAMAFNLATRTYVAEVIHPTLAEKLPPDIYITKIMSGSYISRELFKAIRKQNPAATIKFSSENPRNPLNRAGADEIKLIRYFNQNPKLNFVKRTVAIDGIDYITHVHAMRATEACLKCHGNSADAPKQLIDIYGHEKSFGYHVGQVVGLDAVFFPISAVKSMIQTESIQNTVIIGLGVILLFAGIVFVLGFMVSERRVMEDALSQGQLEKETIMDSITEPVMYFKNPDMVISWANTAACQAAGISKTQISGTQCHKIFSGMEPPCGNCPAKKTFKTGSSHEIETVTPDGKYRMLKSFPVKNKKGHLQGVIEIAYDITAQKTAERRIARSEEKYRTILKTIEDGYYEVDLKGNLIFFNEGLSRILKYPEAELMGMNYRKFMEKDTRQDIYTTFNRVYTTGAAAKSLDVQVICKDGTQRYVNISISLMQDPTGSPSGFRGIARDVTEHRLAGQALAASEEKFRVIAETSLDTIMQLNKNGNVIYVSPAIETLSGYSAKEFIGTHFLKHFPEDQIPLALEIFHNVLSGRIVKSDDLIALHKNGTRVNIGVSFSPLFQNNHIIGLQGTVRDISERKKYEQQIKESEERFRLLAENSNDAIWKLDLNGRHQYVSPATTKIFGYTVEETMGAHFSRYLPEEKLPEAYDVFGKVISGQSVPSYVTEAVRKDGRIIIADFSVAPLIKDGRVVAIQGITRDVTAQKKAERVLAESQKNLASLINAITESVLLVSPAGTIMANNQTAAQRLRGHAEEMAGKNVFDFLEENVVENLKTKLVQVLETQKPIQFEEVRFGRHVWTNFYPILDDHGHVDRIAVFTMDIHERKIAEKSLRESEQRYRTLFESAPLSIILTDAQGRICDYNSSALNIFGYATSDIKHLRAEDVFADPRIYVQLLETLKQNHMVRAKEVQLKKKNHDLLDTLINISTIQIDNQQYILALITDITPQKQVEKELRDAHEKLRQLNKHIQTAREKERTFIARELHDELGQTLTAIHMEASWVAQKAPNELKSIKDKAEAISDLAVGAIGFLKRIITQLRPTLLMDLGLSEAVRWQANEYQQRLGIQFNVDIHLETNTVDEDLGIAIFRIFQEAVTNAVRHAHATVLTVTLTEQNGRIELVVKDNGIGISQDKFASTESFGIMGMRERVEIFGGSLEVSGVPGKGTTLRARFPLREGA